MIFCIDEIVQSIVRWRSDQSLPVIFWNPGPGQTKVSGDHQRETTHEVCCLAAE